MDNFLKSRACLSKEEIKCYLASTLPAKHIKDIENHLLDCALCSDAIDAYKVSPQLLDEMPEVFVPQSSKLIEIGNHRSDSSSFGSNFFFRIAAGLVIFCVFGFLVYQYFYASNSKELFAEAFHTLPPTESNTRSIGEVNLKEVNANSKAMVLYGNKKYEQAANLFEERLKEFPKDNESYLYAGLCYLQLNNNDKAIQYFKLARINSEQFYQPASWYLSLAYLKSGDDDNAKKMLQELVDNSDDYGSKAKELLTKMEQ
ncbi:MAG: tetratricopeptide repeat protein [Saprospiraceae bacterium]|nr:tetratricopeptide repeat protein [Saprospiraceae bacterium]